LALLADASSTSATIRVTTVPEAARPAPDPQHAGAVDGAGEHLVADGLRDRQRLAGDGRLIDVAGAVGADAFPRSHHDHIAHRQFNGVHQLVATVGQ
jgi:hypothetical protein